MFLPGPNYALDDAFLRSRLDKIIRDRDIKCVVETGLNDGQSTLAFSHMAGWVVGIDNDSACIECTRDRLTKAGRTNFQLEQGHSPEVLRRVVQILDSNTMYFLDAHWDGECPILDEIRVIPRGRGVIVLHDFQVPGHRDDPDHEFGWDHMLINGVYHEFNYEFVRGELTAWSPSHRIEYATQVMGSKRGSAYVFPN